MGSIFADAVLAKASILLVDRTKKHWPESELLGWLNDGQLAILQYRPDAYTQVRAVQMAQGSRQSLPIADLRLLDVSRNMGQDGQTPGMACRYIDRKQLDLSNPSWHNAAASATTRHWMYDQQTPKTFWVYPPQPATSRGYLELDVSAVPPLLTITGINGATSTSLLALDDIWLNPLLMFTVYRAFSKDDEYTQVGRKGHMAFQEFLTSIGAKTSTDQQFDPKKNQPPRVLAPPKSDQQGAFG